MMAIPLNDLAARHRLLLDDPRLLDVVLKDHAFISPGHVVPHASLRPEGLARYDAQFHPRGIAYRANPVQRALAHHRERPRSLIAEWSALALFGLEEFSSGADTTLLCSSDRKLAADALQATVRRRKKHHTRLALRRQGIVVPVTDHMQTLSACLKSLDKKEHAWGILADLKMDPVTVMSVQLIDSFYRFFKCGPADVRAGLAGVYSSRRLEKILALSCTGAESKPETILRLLAREAVADLPWVRLETQIPVYTDGTVGEAGEIRNDKVLLTVFDLADRRLRVGFMYDGEHHLQRGQRDKDTEITADLLAFGWRLLRTSAGMLRRTSDTQRRVRTLMLRAADEASR